MHVDEAVHAIKFGALLEHNYYRYDPVEYHGPALNYLTLLPVSFSGKKTLDAVSESDLRIVPALCGLLMILFFSFLGKDLDQKLLFIIVLLLSFSSILVFYNRYYIQESLLTGFTFCLIISLYKFISTGRLLWLLPGGIFAGLAFASKETSIISFAALAISILTVKVSHLKSGNGKSSPVTAALLFFTAFIAVSFLLFSSFFSNPEGAADSVRSISNYFTKAGNFPDHIYPWYYYFSLIVFRKIDSFIFTEIFILLFFLTGAYSVLLRWNDAERRNIFIEIVFIFTLLLILIYSIIPYKTPWSMMTFWTGITVVAAYRISESLKIFSRLKLYLIIIISAGIIHQAWQSYKISFSYQFHPQNPFVYAQATDDMAVISKTISNICGTAADKEKTSICVAAAGDDYWPLPWYLRSFKNAGWFNRIPGDVHRYPIILTSPEFETELLEKLYSTPPPGERNLYIPLFGDYMVLRPGVEIRGYVRKDFYDIFRNSRAD